MEWLIYLLVFIFGAVIGSFLNVVIYRLHTGKSLSGHSHCLSCGIQLSWFELFPVFSYVVLRMRCRHCSARIPSRYALVEIGTGLLFMLLWSVYTYAYIEFTFFAVLASILVVITIYDIRHTIIPDVLVVLTSLLAVLYLVYALFTGSTFVDVLLHVLAGVLASAFIGTLWYVSKGRWIGLGDAKLALPLGAIAGLPEVFSLIVLSFWVGAIISLSLIGFQRLFMKGKTVFAYVPPSLTIKSEVPFAPFLVIGFFLVQLFHANIFDITFKVLGI